MKQSAGKFEPVGAQGATRKPIKSKAEELAAMHKGARPCGRRLNIAQTALAMAEKTTDPDSSGSHKQPHKVQGSRKKRYKKQRNKQLSELENESLVVQEAQAILTWIVADPYGQPGSQPPALFSAVAPVGLPLWFPFAPLGAVGPSLVENRRGVLP